MSIFVLEQLQKARKLAKLSQDDLAQRSGLNRMTVQRTEAQTIDPQISTVAEIAKALGMELIAVPRELKADLDAFIQSGGRYLGQPAGADAPLSIIDVLKAKTTSAGTSRQKE